MAIATLQSTPGRLGAADTDSEVATIQRGTMISGPLVGTWAEWHIRTAIQTTLAVRAGMVDMLKAADMEVIRSMATTLEEV